MLNEIRCSISLAASKIHKTGAKTNKNWFHMLVIVGFRNKELLYTLFLKSVLYTLSNFQSKNYSYGILNLAGTKLYCSSPFKRASPCFSP